MSGEGKKDTQAGVGGDLWEPILRLLEAVAKTLGWKVALATALSSLAAGLAAHVTLHKFAIGAAGALLAVVGTAAYAKARLRMLKEEIGSAQHQISHQIRDSIHSFLVSWQSNVNGDNLAQVRYHRHLDWLIQICGDIKNLFEVITKSDTIGVTLFLTDRAANESGREVPVAVLAYSTRNELRTAEELNGQAHVPTKHSLELGRNLPFHHAVNGDKTAEISYFCTDDSRKCLCHCDVQAFRNTSISLLICPVSCRRTGDVVGFLWLDSPQVGRFGREHRTYAAAVADQLFSYVLLTRIRPATPPTNTARAISARPIKPRAKNAG